MEQSTPQYKSRISSIMGILGWIPVLGLPISLVRTVGPLARYTYYHDLRGRDIPFHDVSVQTETQFYYQTSLSTATAVLILYL